MLICGRFYGNVCVKCSSLQPDSRYGTFQNSLARGEQRMDLGINGKVALICGSSQGLGFACAQALAREGVHVILNGRSADKLEQAVRLLRGSPGTATHVVADLTSEAGRQAAVGAAPQIDILVTNIAGPRPGALAEWDHDAWVGAFEANMIAPMLLIRALLPGMRSRKFGRIVNVTSAMVKAPLPMMGLSTAARTALTAACKAVSRTVVADNVTINNLLPERVDTPRQEFMVQRMMQQQGITREQARQQIMDSIPAKRMGTPAEFADACAYLCSAQAGYITAQNLQLDGGAYAGLI
jgi:3-oxoacyl-[acyl-carrier protein] reductase